MDSANGTLETTSLFLADGVADATEGTVEVPSSGNLNDITSPLNIFYVTVLTLASVAGNIGNVLVIGAVFCDRKLRKEGNVFIVNLAIADLCVTGFVGPFSIVGVFLGHQWFIDRPGLCHTIGSVCLISCVCSLWSIAAISVNRFILLCKQNIYHRIYTWNSAILMSFCLWVWAAILDLPNFLDWGDHAYDMKKMTCSYDRTASYSYTVFFITMFVTIPLTVVVYCNVHIYIFVIKSKIRVAAHKKQMKPNQPSVMETSTNSVGLKPGSPPTRILNVPPEGIIETKSLNLEVANDAHSQHQSNSGAAMKNIKQEVKLAKTLFIIFMAFCSFWSPYAIVCLYDRYDRVSKEVYTIAIMMAHSSSSMNSLLYAATNNNFRNGYKLFMSKWRCA